MKKILLSSLSFFLTFIISCSPQTQETPTKGKIKIIVSESLSPMMKNQVEKFSQLYTESSISMDSAFDRNAIVDFINDSTNIIVTSRQLNQEEHTVLTKYNIGFQEDTVAFDAIAFIVNNENTTSQIRTTQLDSIFSGTVTSWKSVNSSVPLLNILLALPNQNSGNYEYLSSKLLGGKRFKHPDFLAQSTAEIMSFVSKNSNAIGFIGCTWKSKLDSNIKILELQNPNLADSSEEISEKFYPPLQYYIWNNSYPFVKPVYIYSRNIGNGVGMGFISFLLSSHPGEGQKIVGDFGLVPAHMPIRIVQTQKTNIH